MLVQIKGSRLFARFFLEVVARSKTNACPNQRLKTLSSFFFQMLLLGQEPTLV
jgi:hypothetical protein